MPSMSQRDRRFGDPERLRRVVDPSPTLSLNRNLNWKPTRIGENIIGNIIQRAQKPLSARDPFDEQRQAEAEQHLEIERPTSSGARHGAPETFVQEHRVRECVHIIAQADQRP